MGAPRKSLPTAADVLVLRNIEARLDAALGITWRSTYGDAAAAIAEPYVLRLLLGEPEPLAVSDEAHDAAASADELRLHACEAELATALGLDPADTEPGWGEYIEAVERLRVERNRLDVVLGDEVGRRDRWEAHTDAVLRVLGWEDEWTSTTPEPAAIAAELLAAREPVTTIHHSTPEGILALLDAAADAAERQDFAVGLDIESVRDDFAGYLDLPFRNRARWAARQRVTKPGKSEVERMADTLAAHGDAVLLGTLLADVRDLPDVLRAAVAGRGQGEDSALKRIAATALALSRTASKAGAF
jgi:hypothetical protein